MKRSLLLAASLLLAMPSTAFAFTPEERECYATVMEVSIEDKWVVDATSVEPWCACLVNNEKRGLSTDYCPNWGGVPVDKYYKYFEP